MNEIALSRSVGLMSWIFWITFVADPHCSKITYGQAFEASRASSHTHGHTFDRELCGLERAHKELGNLQPEAIVDCWLETENLTRDLQSCLERWDKSKVDWAAFEKLSDPARVPNNQTWLGGADKDPRRHAGSNDTCANAFDANAALRSSVWQSDRLLFEKFGYGSCCEH